MKIRIETIKNLNETEIVIRAAKLSNEVIQIEQALANLGETKIALMRDSKEYFLPINNILFFEAVDGKTYAHTAKHIFTTKHRLYELENTLPRYFMRISKSTVVNSKRILSITRNLTGPSLIHFSGSHKQINVSRQYYKDLRNKLIRKELI